VSYGSKGNARQNTGDVGCMYGIGTMLSRTGATLYEPKIMTDLAGKFTALLPRICTASAQFADSKFPDLRVMINNLERIAGKARSSFMGGGGGVSHSMNVSMDLGNASHYDVNDASPGYSIWTESEPGTASNWYFMLPNILLKRGNQTYYGVAIRLFHGVAISWDGRVIRHGTSITTLGSKDNHTFGWFWAADSKPFIHLLKQKQEEASNR